MPKKYPYISSPYKEKGIDVGSLLGVSNGGHNKKCKCKTCELLKSAGTTDKPGKAFSYDQSQGGKG